LCKAICEKPEDNFRKPEEVLCKEDSHSESSEEIVFFDAAGPGPTYRRRALENLPEGTIGRVAYELLEAGGAPVYYRDLVGPVRDKLGGDKLSGKRPETTLYTILKSLDAVEFLGGGYFQVVAQDA
jgi:hypothetical protein